MTTARKIVIVGGGPAGVGAALAARQQDAAAEIVLLSDEPCEPYEKPPLSKAVLTGKAMPQDAPIAGPEGRRGASRRAQERRARARDRSRRARGGDGGRRAHPLRRARARDRLDQPRAADVSARPGIHYLRTAAEALALKAHLDRSQSLLVIGGG